MTKHYNPHEPLILGNEWPGLRFSREAVDKIVEYGTTFSLPVAATIVSGAYYVPEPIESYGNHPVGINVYPRGLEGASGPVKQLILPVLSGSVTGTGAGFDCTVFGATTIQDALRTPNDNCSAFLTGAVTTPTSRVFVNFDVQTYSPQLSGKRILRVELLYDIVSHDTTTNTGMAIVMGTLPLGTSAATYASQLTTHTDLDRNIEAFSLGDTTLFFSNPVGSSLGSANIFAPIWPWTYEQLLRWDTVTPIATRLTLMFAGGTVDIHYVAMRVTYCEEKRVAVGVQDRPVIDFGQNMIPLRAPTLVSGGVTLQPGEYTVTAYRADYSQGNTAVPSQEINSIRQLYRIPDHTGLSITRKYVPGEQFDVAETNVMRQLSLHQLGGGMVTGVHSYGEIVPSAAHDTQVTSQDIGMAAVSVTGTSTYTYPQVRFYARRSDNTDKVLNFFPNGTGSPVASISPAEFDALPEIVDGWKEITLRWTNLTVLSLPVTGGWLVWNWWPAGQDAGNPWEILGVSAGASIARPPNSAAVTAIANGTYGGKQFRYWLNNAWNDFADAVVMLSTDPPIPTSFSLQTLSQAVTGIGTECLATNACVPTAIKYNRITWIPGGYRDIGDRTVVDGLGNFSTGQAWDIPSTLGPVADYDVTNGQILISLPSANVSHYGLTSASTTKMMNSDVYMTFIPNQTPTVAELRTGIVSRWLNLQNFYEYRLIMNTNGVVEISVNRILNGVVTFVPGSIAVESVITGVTAAAGRPIRVRAQTEGPVFRFKAWNSDTQVEPSQWQYSVVDDQTPYIGQTGFRVRTDVGNTNVGMVVAMDDVEINNLDLNGYELQRFDAVDNEWKTIMLTTDTKLAAFNDYEARVGVASNYRIRSANALDFYSLWSSEISATIPTPGVTVGGDGNSTLIFTTNYDQTGAKNLAYSMVWDGSISEDFTFVEASSWQLQQAYQRDYQIGFHPTERGGESFARQILVNAAAVPLPSLGNFKSLRDMSWANSPYICVRDELGNRWFAAVIVPDGRVRRNRRLYVASVQIIEVTEDPAIISLDSAN
jgi:hypothetical protein